MDSPCSTVDLYMSPVTTTFSKVLLLPKCRSRALSENRIQMVKSRAGKLLLPWQAPTLYKCPGLDQIFMRLRATASFTVRPSCPHLSGSSSSLGTNVTISNHLIHLPPLACEGTSFVQLRLDHIFNRLGPTPPMPL